MFSYSGYSGVPGAPGNIAGSPGYFMGDKEIQDRLYRYGMQETTTGQDLLQRMEQLRQQFPWNRQAQDMQNPYPVSATNYAGNRFFNTLVAQRNAANNAGFDNKRVS